MALPRFDALSIARCKVEQTFQLAPAAGDRIEHQTAYQAQEREDRQASGQHGGG